MRFAGDKMGSHSMSGSGGGDDEMVEVEEGKQKVRKSDLKKHIKDNYSKRKGMGEY